MITPKEKVKLKKIIGNRYVHFIEEELKDKVNLKGNPYSCGQIVNVMNGEPHIIIENAIFSVYSKLIVEYEELKEHRKRLLNIK